MPPVLGSGPELNGTADDDAARGDAWHRDVGVERMAAGAEGLAGDDMNAHPPADGQVQVARERRAPGMRLHLDVVPNKGDAIKPKAANARHHCGPRPVLQDEAEPIFLRAQADEIGQAGGEGRVDVTVKRSSVRSSSRPNTTSEASRR